MESQDLGCDGIGRTGVDTFAGAAEARQVRLCPLMVYRIGDAYPPVLSGKTLRHGSRDWARLDVSMVTARELTQTLRARSAERRAKAEVRAERLRAQLPKAASMLVTHYQARRVVLFGSLANGTHDEQSDVDLAVEGLPSAVYFHALADLMDLFAGPVDLVRIEEAMPSLLERIQEEGQVL